MLLLSLFGTLAAIIVWSALSQIDQVTRGDGKVVSSLQMQTIQSVEGGIIKKILVKEGDIVNQGDPLVEIDQSTIVSQYNQALQQYYTLLAHAVRLTAEANGKAPDFPDALRQGSPAVTEAETQLYLERQRQLTNDVEVLKSELIQRQQELNETNVSMAYAEKSLDSLQDQMKMIQPLVDKGIEPRTTLMEEERQLDDLQSKRDSGKEALIRLQAAIQEVNQKIGSAQMKFRSDSLSELSTVTGQLAEMEQTLPAFKDRVEHNEIRSPIKGVVNRVLDYTIGGVAPSATPLIEIAPLSDTLRVDVNIAPKDIAFIHVGQPVLVKLTAYDFSRYGGLKGKVANISADAVKVSKDDNNTAYIVQITTDTNYLQSGNDKYYIMPGMVASVDVITGKQTILNYLIAPVLRLKENAFQE